MANIALHLGSAGLTIVLFVGATLLAMEDNAAWEKFFAIGMYLGTWNTIHAVTRRAAALLIDSHSKEAISLLGIWLSDGRKRAP